MRLKDGVTLVAGLLWIVMAFTAYVGVGAVLAWRLAIELARLGVLEHLREASRALD